MRSDLFVKLKHQSSIILLSVGKVCVTYFVMSLTMPDLQSNDMRNIQ